MTFWLFWNFQTEFCEFALIRSLIAFYESWNHETLLFNQSQMTLQYHQITSSIECQAVMKRRFELCVMTHENCSTCCNEKIFEPKGKEPSNSHFLAYLYLEMTVFKRPHKLKNWLWSYNRNRQRSLDIYPATKREAWARWAQKKSGQH